MVPKIIQSPTITWAASRTFPIDLSCLDAVRDMVAPVIDEVLLVLNITGIDTGVSGIRGGAIASAFSQVLVQDSASEVVNLRGSSLRVVNQVEYGAGYQDPAAIAISLTGQARKLFLRVPFNPPKARRRRDFGLELRRFLDGGKMQVTTSAALLPGGGATSGTITAATICAYFFVRDEGSKEAKSRMIFTDEAVNAVDYSYNLGGAARWISLYNGEINERSATAWTAMTVSSRSLEMQQVDDYILNDRYQIFHKPARSSPGIVATADTYAQTDVHLTGQAVSIIPLDDDLKIPEMFQATTLHLRSSLGSVTTSDLPQVIKCVITERSANATARVLGTPDPAAALASGGHLKAANGNSRSLASFPRSVARFMPAKAGKRTA